MSDEWLITTRSLTITNAPGTIPSVTKVAKGQRFQLDGDEPINVGRLFAQGMIEVYTGSSEQLALQQEGKALAKKKRDNPFRRKKGA